MDAPRTSLNTFLPWPETGHRLRLALTDSALPARTTCPLCAAERFTVYADSAQGGAWIARHPG